MRKKLFSVFKDILDGVEFRVRSAQVIVLPIT